MESSILLINCLLVGLASGIFLAFSLAVSPGLAQLKDDSYVRAMQYINRVILNPAFYLLFIGPVLLLPVSCFLLYGGPAFWLTIAATVLYLGGMFILTIAGNVPLNDKLDKVEGDAKAYKAGRLAFEKPWDRLHAIRTVAGILSSVLLLKALSLL